MLCSLGTRNVKKAFAKFKHLLSTTPIMQTHNWSLQFELMCDACDYAVGAVLSQIKDKKREVIYYSSRTHNDTQINYTTTEKGILAIVFSLDKFRSYLINLPLSFSWIIWLLSIFSHKKIQSQGAF